MFPLVIAAILGFFILPTPVFVLVCVTHDWRWQRREARLAARSIDREWAQMDGASR